MIAGKEIYLPCPCCGNPTISEIGVYEICPICYWEDDPIQFNDPSYSGGANKESLSKARERWREKV